MVASYGFNKICLISKCCWVLVLTPHWAMCSALAQLALGFQKYSCTLALLAKNCSLKSFPDPCDPCQEGPSMHRSPRWYKVGGHFSSLPFCCVSRMLWWQDVASEQKLPARHKQQSWKAQGKKIIELETASRNRTERMGVPCPWLLLSSPRAHISQRPLKGHRAVGQILLRGRREVLFGVNDFLSSIREGGRLAGWLWDLTLLLHPTPGRGRSQSQFLLGQGRWLFLCPLISLKRGCWAPGITLTFTVQRDFISFFVALKAAGHAYKFQYLPAKAKQDPTIKVEGSSFLSYCFLEKFSF